MRPARKGPENLVAHIHRMPEGVLASMRPARKGPENRGAAPGLERDPRRFNEAGPQGAGKPCAPRRSLADLMCGFNEAGPQGAGKPRSVSRVITHQPQLQ